MSLRRSVGIPLLAMVASFAIVLAFGDLFGTSAASPAQPQPAAASGDVRILIDTQRLAAGGGAQEPFPGLRISTSAMPSGKSGPAGNVCVSRPAADWQITSAGWSSPNPTSRPGLSCHGLNRLDGQLQPVELWLARP
ncbi:MAG: hypothetical protein V7637_1461 [Mycobacteriales bacterium]